MKTFILILVLAPLLVSTLGGYADKFKAFSRWFGVREDVAQAMSDIDGCAPQRRRDRWGRMLHRRWGRG